MRGFLDKKILNGKLNVFCWYCRDRCLYKEKALKLLGDPNIKQAIREILEKRDLRKYIEFIVDKGLAYCILGQIAAKAGIDTLKAEMLAGKYLLQILKMRKWKEE